MYSFKLIFNLKEKVYECSYSILKIHTCKILLIFRRRRTLSHTPAPHWSTHVTVTPSVTNHTNNNNNNNSLGNGAKPGGSNHIGKHGDRMTLLAYSDQVHTIESESVPPYLPH